MENVLNLETYNKYLNLIKEGLVLKMILHMNVIIVWENLIAISFILDNSLYYS